MGATDTLARGHTAQHGFDTLDIEKWSGNDMIPRNEHGVNKGQIQCLKLKMRITSAIQELSLSNLVQCVPRSFLHLVGVENIHFTFSHFRYREMGGRQKKFSAIMAKNECEKK